MVDVFFIHNGGIELSKQRGNRRITIRANGDLHAKLGRLAANTGTDKSAIVRSCVGWLSEEQIAAIITSSRGQQQRVVNHAL